jgi:hypothetical protein
MNIRRLGVILLLSLSLLVTGSAVAGAQEATPGATPIATTVPTSAATPVVALPNTGQGTSSDNNGSIILLLGAMSLVAGAAAYSWQQRRSNN